MNLLFLQEFVNDSANYEIDEHLTFSRTRRMNGEAFGSRFAKSLNLTAIDPYWTFDPHWEWTHPQLDSRIYFKAVGNLRKRTKSAIDCIGNSFVRSIYFFRHATIAKFLRYSNQLLSFHLLLFACHFVQFKSTKEQLAKNHRKLWKDFTTRCQKRCDHIFTTLYQKIDSRRKLGKKNALNMLKIWNDFSTLPWIYRVLLRAV